MTAQPVGAAGAGGGEETLTVAVVLAGDFGAEIAYNKISAKRENAGLRTPRSLINIAYVGGVMTTKDSTALPQNKQEYYVYLIQGTVTLVTKIGISDTPSRRLRQIQRHSPERLYVCATLACKNEGEARRIESELHWKFADYRTLYEWFDIPACEIAEQSKLNFVWHMKHSTPHLMAYETPHPRLRWNIPVQAITSPPTKPKPTWPLKVALYSLVSVKIAFAIATAFELKPEYDLLGWTAVTAVSAFAVIINWWGWS